MDLKKILSISGKSGLYKLLTESKNCIIVESLSDNKRFPVYASTNFSALEEISIYTNDEDLKLADAFKMIYEKLKGEKAISHKSNPKELKDFFEDAIPNYDKEKVYVSDIKKAINWYNYLHDYKMLDFTEEAKEEENKEENKEDEKIDKKTKTEDLTEKEKKPIKQNTQK